MKRRTVSISKAKADLSDLVNGVAFAGEEVVIAWHGKPRAVLVPVARGGRRVNGGAAASARRALRKSARLSQEIDRRLRRERKSWTSVVEDLRALRRERSEQRR